MIKYSIIITFLILFSCSKEKEIQPIRKDIKELVFASGELSWEDKYSITAQTDGILIEDNFDLGDRVSKGDFFASIDNKTNPINTRTSIEQLEIYNENLTQNSPQIQQLEQNIQFAQTKYEQDKIQAERYQRLYQSQSVAKVEYENMQVAMKNSLSNLNALQKQKNLLHQQAKLQQITSKGQVKNNQVLENYNKIAVQQSGIIIQKFKSKGDYVKKGDVLATIANDNNVEAVLSIDENSIDKIKLDQLVYIKLNSNREKVYTGKITEILSAFDQQTQSFICKATFNETISKNLYGTQLEANILVGEKKNALLIPRECVGYGNKVNVKGKDENVIIKSGIVSSDYVEVLSGINLNDVILPLKP